MSKDDPQQVQKSSEEIWVPGGRPDGSSSSSRRKLVSTFIWLLNSLLGVSAVVVGGHDLLSPRAPERAIGAVFFIGGLALATSAIWALVSSYGSDQTNNDRARNLALGGFILGLMPGVALVVIQINYSGYSYRNLLWLLAVASPALGTILLWQRGARLALFRATSSVAILAAGIALLPPLLGGAFRPVVDPTIVDAQMDMEVVGRRHDPKLGNVAVVECKLTIKNIGKRRLIFVGSLYSVQGIDSNQRKIQSKTNWPKDADWPMSFEWRGQSWSGRFESPWNEATVAEIGYDFFSPGDTLEPGQQVVLTLLPVVPFEEYDTVEAYATVATALDNRLTLGAQKARVEEQTLTRETPVEAIWDIEPTGWVTWLTQGWQNLRVAYGMDSHQNRFAGLYLELDAGTYVQRQQTFGEYNPRAFTAYGLGWTTASDSVILDVTSP